MRTQRALKECSEFLCYCLRIGWNKESLDAIEAIWWQFHDDTGTLIARRK